MTRFAVIPSKFEGISGGSWDRPIQRQRPSATFLSAVCHLERLKKRALVKTKPGNDFSHWPVPVGPMVLAAEKNRCEQSYGRLEQQQKGP